VSFAALSVVVVKELSAGFAKRFDRTTNSAHTLADIQSATDP